MAGSGRMAVPFRSRNEFAVWLPRLIISCALALPLPARAGNTSYPTGSQSYQPNDGPCNNPYGCGRGYDTGGAWPAGRDVYCQQSPGMPMYGPYRGTGTQTPCGPAFQTQAAPPPPPAAPTTCNVSSGQAAALPPGVPVGLNAATNMAQLWKTRIDNFWSAQYRGQGSFYRPPMLINTPGQLQYDPNTMTIEYDPAILSGIIQDTGNFGLVIALAHEAGHHIQMLNGTYMRMTPLQREQNADRLAGAYLAWAQRNGFVQNCDFASAAMTVFRAGDALPAFDPQAHGSPRQRVHNMIQGYLYGP